MEDICSLKEVAFRKRCIFPSLSLEKKSSNWRKGRLPCLLVAWMETMEVKGNRVLLCRCSRGGYKYGEEVLCLFLLWGRNQW